MHASVENNGKIRPLKIFQSVVESKTAPQWELYFPVVNLCFKKTLREIEKKYTKNTFQMNYSNNNPVEVDDADLIRIISDFHHRQKKKFKYKMDFEP